MNKLLLTLCLGFCVSVSATLEVDIAGLRERTLRTAIAEIANLLYDDDVILVGFTLAHAPYVGQLLNTAENNIHVRSMAFRFAEQPEFGSGEEAFYQLNEQLGLPQSSLRDGHRTSEILVLNKPPVLVHCSQEELAISPPLFPSTRRGIVSNGSSSQ